jgi:hypothetical protein
MRRTLRVAIALTTFLVGCGPKIFAYPPPAMLPGSIEPLGGGEVDLGVGFNGIVSGEAATYGPFFNNFGGPFNVGAGVGLGHGVDVSIVGSRHLQGPTGGLTVGLWLLDEPTLQAGPIVGIAGSLADDTSMFTLPVHGADGPVVDENGTPVTTTVQRHYAYATIAPSVGGRFVWRPSEHWSVPVALRGSYSVSMAGEGLGNWDMPRTTWIEGLAGVGWSPNDHFTLAFATGVLAPVGPDAPFGASAVVSASAHVRFDTIADP